MHVCNIKLVTETVEKNIVDYGHIGLGIMKSFGGAGPPLHENSIGKYLTTVEEAQTEEQQSLSP